MAVIYLHNTLTGRKEEFKPIEPGKAGIYSCGPTVYNFPTVGNMRSYVFSDTLRRTFEYFGYEVKQVINITDVGHLVSDADEGEDKIEKSAKSQGKTAGEVVKFYEEAFHQDLKDLNIETAGTKFPRASEHIKEQLEIIKILEEKGFTYQTTDGIYFDTSKFSEYGKLGNINLAGLKEGARVEANNQKKNPSDFALWKFSGGDKRLQEWNSPWGVGFPGWHIECSAMSAKYLGQPFDIHTGGIDHIPVHHNNEIAQSVCAYGKPLANYWLHNEFLAVDREKMSKSLGNAFTLADLKERKIHPLSFRYWLLSGKYNSPMNFTWESLSAAQTGLEKIVIGYSSLPEVSKAAFDMGGFEEAIADDLNMPVALSLLQEAPDKKTVDKMDEVLGLNIKKLSEEISDISKEIREIQKQRDEAREKQDWKLSDDLRDQIESKGYIVKDATPKTLIYNTLSNLSQNS